MTRFKITVTSDTVCPWCYIGRKQLQTAEKIWQQRYPDANDTFAVSYLPFQLAPDWPKGPSSSRSKRQFYIERFGEERMLAMQERVGDAGRATGIEFKFGGQTGNSRDSHRLVRLSKKYGQEAEGKALDGLFAAYFEKEGDITDYETLKGIAIEAGIPAEDFQKAIVESDEGGKDVDEAALAARYSGVSGVPDFVIQDAYRLSGARDPLSFIKVFETIKKSEAAKGV
ncbi:hypothetical protein G7046_g1329 [Stylonectria norvegica]|nr:hypothetical protein G7046_g1329 [Stylonectria norvegica]